MCMVRRSRQMVLGQEWALHSEEPTDELHPFIRHICVGVPYGIIQLSIQRIAMGREFVLEVATALVSSAKRSVITSANWWLFNVFGDENRFP